MIINNYLVLLFLKLFLKYFLFITPTSVFRIARHQESGIYLKWLASYSEKRIRRKKVVKCKPAELKHFYGLFVICFGLLILAVLLQLFESWNFVKNTEMFTKTQIPGIQRQNYHSHFFQNMRFDWNSFAKQNKIGLQILFAVWFFLPSDTWTK